MGARKARADGVPLQSFREDQLSASFRRTRTALAAEADAAARARRDRARQTAADVVARHGPQLVIEDTSIAAWAKTWGRALAAFSPGMLVDAIDREARAVAALAGGSGGVQRASTRMTALSQHCPCGARVNKRLADRVHTCAACELRGDRDAVAAVLASFTVVVERGNPRSAPGRLRRVGRCTRQDSPRSSLSVRGVARHPDRVNRPLSPRWFVRRVEDVHTATVS